MAVKAHGRQSILERHFEISLDLLDLFIYLLNSVGGPFYLTAE